MSTKWQFILKKITNNQFLSQEMKVVLSVCHTLSMINDSYLHAVMFTRDNKWLIQYHSRNNHFIATIFLLKVTLFKSTPSPAATTGTNSELHISGALGGALIMSWVINIRNPLCRFCWAQNKSYWRQLSPRVIRKKWQVIKEKTAGHFGSF